MRRDESMKILLINGSPKGKRSNSLKLAYSFIEGFKNGCTDDEEIISIDELHVASMNIAACKGCFACWQKTPGICCIKDDEDIEDAVSAYKQELITNGLDDEHSGGSKAASEKQIDEAADSLLESITVK